jgi:hypothetical protein
MTPGIAMGAGKAAIGIGQSVASALNQPVLDFVVMPRSKRGKERFPMGVHVSIPAWLLVAAPFVVAWITGAIKLGFGDQLTKEEKEVAKKQSEATGGANFEGLAQVIRGLGLG